MTHKILPFLVAVAVSAGLFALGCGGGGSGAGSAPAPYVTRVFKPAGSGIASLANAQLSSAASSYAYGFYDSTVNSVQVNQALALNTDTGEATNWNPSGFDYSIINGTDGVQQVGYGVRPDHSSCGLIWSNSPDNPIEVLPAGVVQVDLYAVDNGVQVGLGTPAGNGQNHPFAYHGNGAAADLAPAGFAFGQAQCISGNNIGGYVQPTASNELPQAAYWSSLSAASFVNLQPAGYQASCVLGISADQQGGWGQTDQTDVDNDQVIHALIWTGTAASVVDLNPSDNQGSEITAVRNGKQVGFYYDKSDPLHHKACAWSSTAGSFVDLDHLLPGSEYSTAYAIDDQGRVYGSYVHDGEFWTAVWTPN